MEQVREYFDFLLPLVKQAGKVILEAKDIEIECKEDDYDLVTMYDRKVEAALIAKLRKRYPNHKFISEEDSAARKTIDQLTDDPTWIIDPIDGTSNFVRKFPITCISVGLTVGRELVLGIVYNPFMDELYTAIKGEGAYLNNKPITTSKLEEIGNAVFNYEISLARSEKYRDLYMRRLSHLIAVVQGVRSLGSAALGLCYVASGWMDAYQCDGLYPWDAAAGVLIVREAGGYVCDTNGSEFNLMNPNFIATSTSTLADRFMEIERHADDEAISR